MVTCNECLERDAIIDKLRAQVERWEKKEIRRASCCTDHQLALERIMNLDGNVEAKAIAEKALVYRQDDDDPAACDERDMRW